MSRAKKPIKLSKRKFYKTVITVEVLSDEPKDFEGLGEAAYAIDEGDCVGRVKTTVKNRRIGPETCVRLLRQYGSEEGFFQLTAKGEDAT